MLGFLKIFLQGVLYVVLLPFILVLLALYAVYCVFVFIYIAIRSIIVFFMGGTPLGDLPEDVEAKRILMERNQPKEDATQQLANAIAQSQLQIAQSLYNQQNPQPVQQPVSQEPMQQNDLEQPSFEFNNEQENDEQNIEENNDDFTY